MDPNWTSAPPKGSLPCLLCKCVISFANKDKTKYFRHLTLDHGAMFNMNLVLIVNLLEKRQLLRLISKIKGEEGDEEKKKRETKDAQVQTDPPTFNIQETEDDIMIMNQLADEMDHDPLLDVTGDFSILDVTKDDLVMTPGGPKPVQDYSSFAQGALVPVDYDQIGIDSVNTSSNSLESIAESSLLETSSSLDTVVVSLDTQKQESPVEHEPQSVQAKVQDLIQTIPTNSYSSEDMVSIYLQSCSEYFKKFPHQLKSASASQVPRFDQEDPTLPAGWRVKITLRNNPKLSEKAREIREFMSPEFKVFRSKVRYK